MTVITPVKGQVTHAPGTLETLNNHPQATTSTAPVKRHWLANLSLEFRARGEKTVLAAVEHLGPLRVQRPFYPEGPHCSHVYLLHPPGGLVVGDQVNVNGQLQAGTHALLTTPSAGKVYGVPGGGETQQQTIKLHCQANAQVEWLPQETLVFDGAKAKLLTQFHLQGNAKLFAWDIVCLGRPASRLPFLHGSCLQQVEVWQDKRLLYLEKNLFKPNTAFMHQKWGLQGAHTTGTLIATVTPSRATVGDLVAQLQSCSDALEWGLTQKQSLFTARYMGNSALECRKGFELIWRALRPLWCGKPALTPRIWLT